MCKTCRAGRNEISSQQAYICPSSINNMPGNAIPTTNKPVQRNFVFGSVCTMNFWTPRDGPPQLHGGCFADSSKENRLQRHLSHRLYTRDLDGGHSQKRACLACSFFIGCAPVSRHFSSSFLIGSETKNGLAKSSTGSAKQTRF